MSTYPTIVSHIRDIQALMTRWGVPVYPFNWADDCPPTAPEDSGKFCRECVLYTTFDTCWPRLVALGDKDESSYSPEELALKKFSILKGERIFRQLSLGDESNKSHHKNTMETAASTESQNIDYQSQQVVVFGFINSIILEDDRSRAAAAQMLWDLPPDLVRQVYLIAARVLDLPPARWSRADQLSVESFRAEFKLGLSMVAKINV